MISMTSLISHLNGKILRIDDTTLHNRMKESPEVERLIVNRRSKEIGVGELTLLREGMDIAKIGRIQSDEEIDNSTSYMELNFPKCEKRIQEISDIFRGIIIVDLGAGENSFGYKLACLANAKGYIGVEPYHSRILRAALLSVGHQKSWEDKTIPFAVVDTDMLSFLRAIKDKSVSLMAAGIDDYVIHGGGYTSLLRPEVERTLSPQGGFLSIKSDVYSSKTRKKVIIDGSESDYIDSTITIFKG